MFPGFGKGEGIEQESPHLPSTACLSALAGDTALGTASPVLVMALT